MSVVILVRGQAKNGIISVPESFLPSEPVHTDQFVILEKFFLDTQVPVVCKGTRQNSGIGWRHHNPVIIGHGTAFPEPDFPFKKPPKGIEVIHRAEDFPERNPPAV
jgi:hypothetical protein